MNNTHYSCDVLELGKVLAKGAEHTACPESARLMLDLHPFSSLYKVQNQLNDTRAAFDLAVRYGMPSMYGLKVVAPSLKKASGGGMLSMKELLDVASVLTCVRKTIQYRASSAETSTCLDPLFDSLTKNKPLEDKIYGSIVSEEEMSDNASPTLADIRRKSRLAAEKIRQALDRIVKSQEHQKHLQDQVVTLRDGRFVIPVKSEHRADIPGLVHDTSASGSTLFVEPIAAVEANNELKVLKSKEQAEIERILYALSADVGVCADIIARDNQNLLKIDFIFAKASLAYDYNAVCPSLNNEGRIELIAARHPLIDKKKAVPIDVSVGGAFDTLIITGPNTGGKTVALKTVGLLTLMTMCGLMIPVKEGSSVSVFDGIYADIGDEQSIEQSLSTFSAHMTNIVRIIGLADEHSLVLFDELGSGTDPVEGAALAATVVEHLREKHCRIMATTHYAELKMFALETEGVENASCEFDVKTLRPTFRLLTGIPGKSNAFAISARLGMPSELVDRARNRISEDNNRFERIITELDEQRKEAESAARESANAYAQAQATLKQAQKDAKALVDAAEKEAEKARAEAKRIISNTRATSENLVNEIDELRRKAERENQAALLSQARSKMKSAVRKMEDEADPVRNSADDCSYVLPRELKRGDSVTVTDMGSSGTVLSVDSKKGTAEVAVGVMKMRVEISRLRLNDGVRVKKPPERTYRSVHETNDRRTSLEVDVRGKTVDEALIEVERFIDSSLTGNLSFVTVIHGKGTGALRAGIHEYLRHNRHVKSFRLGAYGEGDAGVTIIELK